MKVLVIVDQDLKVDEQFIHIQLNEEVTHNSVSQDGISIFDCGKPIPDEEWDWVAQIGNCMAEINVSVDVNIPLDEDPIGTLISAVSAVKEGMVVDEDIGE